MNGFGMKRQINRAVFNILLEVAVDYWIVSWTFKASDPGLIPVVDHHIPIVYRPGSKILTLATFSRHCLCRERVLGSKMIQLFFLVYKISSLCALI